MKPATLDTLWSQLDAGGADAVLAEAPDVAITTDGCLESAGDAAAAMLRGLACYESGDPAGADRMFSAVLAQDPGNPVARLNRGLARYRLGRPADAAADLGGGPLFPGHPFLKRFLELFWPLRFAEPGMLGVEIPGAASGPGGPSKLQKRAMRAFESGDMATATALFTAAHESAPDKPEPRVNAAFCRLHLGQSAAAADLLAPLVREGLRERGPGQETIDPYLVVVWAWVLHTDGNHRGALDLLSTVRPEGPDDYQAHVLAGCCWLLLDNPAAAGACFDHAFGVYFLDTWELFVKPFYRLVVRWLESC